MLYKALIDRIFGNNFPANAENATSKGATSVVSWKRYPNLAEWLVKFLKLDVSTSWRSLNARSPGEPHTEVIFLVLEITHRAGPPPGYHELARSAIIRYLGSSIWLIRTMAARAFASVVQERDGIQELRLLYDTSCLSQNELHGRLLAVKQIIDALLAYETIPTGEYA